MNSQITAIIFDLGNVLLGWDARRLYNRLLPDPGTVDRFLEQVRFMEWNAKQDAGRPFREGVAELSWEFPQYSDLIHAYDTDWEESLTGTHDETIQLARGLKRAGWTLHLLSNFSAEKFALVKSRYNFFDLFDEIIISGEHKTIKPDAAIFNIALMRIKRPPEECVFIDDSLANIQTARTLGFQTIHYQSPTQLKADLERLEIKGTAP